MENSIQRGEVYFIFLDPAFGREIGGYKTRPVVVVSIDDIHQKTRMVAVVPGTTSASTHSNVVRVNKGTGNGLQEITYFQCHQIRAVDQGRMTSRPLGRLSRVDFEEILSGLKRSLGLLDRP
jgi:mRNA-degrading endonuclease toxin of MazEF toxin-antitoxin module